MRQNIDFEFRRLKDLFPSKLVKMCKIQNQEDFNHRNVVSKCASACGLV